MADATLYNNAAMDSTPRYIKDASTNSALAVSTGNIAIGQNSATQKLHVKGHVLATGPNGYVSSGDDAAFYMGSTSSYVKNVWGDATYLSSENAVKIQTSASNRNITIIPNGTGNVGINTPTPYAKLHVAGRILVDGIPPLGSIGSPGDKKGMIVTDLSYIYVCVANYDGTTDIWRRSSLAGGSW